MLMLKNRIFRKNVFETYNSTIYPYLTVQYERVKELTLYIFFYIKIKTLWNNYVRLFLLSASPFTLLVSSLWRPTSHLSNSYVIHDLPPLRRQRPTQRFSYCVRHTTPFEWYINSGNIYINKYKYIIYKCM